MKTKRKPIREIIRDHIVEDILKGRINAGEKLLEAEIAGRFHVSRTPVREALLQLEREGYISLTKNVGAIVRKITVKEVKEIYEVLAQLEALATEMAIDNLTKRDISNLKSLLKSMGKSIKMKDYGKYVKDNLEFHKYFLIKSGNESLNRIVVDLRSRIYGLVSQGLTLPMYAERYLEWHEKIVEAVDHKDAKKAGRIVKAHINEVKQRLLEKMNDQ
jgi:DNA-binding GntR family transcriptional regulator